MKTKLKDKDIELIRLVFQDYVENLDNSFDRRLTALLNKLYDIKEEQHVLSCVDNDN